MLTLMQKEMTSRVMITSSDSEGENDNIPITAPSSDSNGESERSRSAERFHFSSQNVHESDDEPTHPAEPAPLISPSPSGVRGRTIRTARKRVAIPTRRRVIRSPRSAVPSTDPYQSAFHNAHNWEWIPDILKRWRHDERLPRTTEVGESSTAQPEFPYTCEPPHLTTPILVARLSSQENRIDIIEDALMELPGSDVVVDLQQQINSSEERVTELEENIGELKNQLKESIAANEDLRQRMEQMEHHMDKCLAMANAATDMCAFIVKEKHLPKKDP